VRVAFVGGGYMGEAMLSALLEKGLAEAKDITVSDVAEARREALKSQYGVNATDDNASAIKDASLVILAVKPQDFSNVAAGLRGRLTSGQTVLSIMAGVPTERISRELDHNGLARAMPNTAALIGQAMSTWIAGPKVSAEGHHEVERLLQAMGRALEVDDEKYLDMATAVAGSGPAFVYLFLESLIEGAVALGIEPGRAHEMCLQTLIGAAMLARETGKEPSELRAMVTSKGGTTAAGLQVLDEAGLRGTVVNAIEAAYKRAKDLGG